MATRSMYLGRLWSRGSRRAHRDDLAWIRMVSSMHEASVDGSTMRTPASLLERLRVNPSDPEAWRQLVERYGPRVYVWCRRWGLQEADARDATQNVLVKIFGRMGRFRYDPARSFRSYLKTTAYYAWCDLIKSRAIPEVAGDH